MTLKSFFAACFMTLAGVALYFAPEEAERLMRGAVTDMLRPGQQAVRVTKESAIDRIFGLAATIAPDVQNNVAQLSEELEVERTRYRALQVRLAQLDEQKLPEREISAALARAQRLILPTLIDAAVLGDSAAEKWRAGKLIDLGGKNGLRESELVLAKGKQQKPLIDLGDDTDISVDDALLLGRCAIGKVEHVGKWTSTVQLVTDAQYRGRAQLIRETTDGLFVFEAHGILKGQGGPLCRLDGIPAEKSVRVNDAVYTADRDGTVRTPLYYGRVVEAALGTDDREWTVVVKPAPLPTHLTRVQVLRMAANPERLAVK